MRISDWSSDVCSSDLADADRDRRGEEFHDPVPAADGAGRIVPGAGRKRKGLSKRSISRRACGSRPAAPPTAAAGCRAARRTASPRSEEHKSELQSLMRISSAVFCLKNKKNKKHIQTENIN